MSVESNVWWGSSGNIAAQRSEIRSCMGVSTTSSMSCSKQERGLTELRKESGQLRERGPDGAQIILEIAYGGAGRLPGIAALDSLAKDIYRTLHGSLCRHNE